jgi:hypothetical protein
MLKTYYLKTTDETELYRSLESAGLATRDYDPEDPNNIRPDDLDPEQEWEPTGAFTYRFAGPRGSALDIIGTIYEETGNILTDEDGVEYPETVPIDGFHANLLAPSEYTGDLPEVEVPPATPHRIFAGQV